MSSAKASGADTGGGSAQSRDHKQGNQQRTFTPDQEAAVTRIRKCNPTAFYEILVLEKTCSDSEIKKAYRKQSLLTHPDKNGHQHADEAFKMVSRAFGVLGDKEKREKFDRFGTDPDSRFSSAQAQNPFSGFASRQASGGMGGGGGGWGEEQMSPEEMFARFFGGGGGGGAFDTGPQFVFNFGGGPGIRVHQFGGARPRRRPREAQQGQQQEQGGLQNLIGLLPILLFFVLPMLTNLFGGGGDSTPATPRMVYDNPLAPFTEGRTTPNLNVPYFVNPADIATWSKSKLSSLDRKAEVNLVRHLRNECDNELMRKQRMREEASGWFYQDTEKMAEANAFRMPSCERLQTLGVGR
ncbi:DUF1977-domain-containing protein [Sarocladium strictum]